MLPLALTPMAPPAEVVSPELRTMLPPEFLIEMPPAPAEVLPRVSVPELLLALNEVLALEVLTLMPWSPLRLM